jgi:ABC-type transporter lipoprotein component MlaA
MLQGKWSGARDESYRFACNTTVGVAGFFDVASKWKIPKADADFGQTFGQWGWQPQCFIMLPLFGPSNDRDVVGFAADTAVNPLLYISPYAFALDNPLTWLGPYSYFTYAVMYNDLSDSVGEYVRFSQAEMDPYSEIQYAWTFARANRVADFQVKGKQDEASLETLESWPWPNWFTKTVSRPYASAALSIPNSWKMPRRRICRRICRWMATICTSR